MRKASFKGETKLNEYQLFIKKTFDRFKCKNKSNFLKCIPVYDDTGTICGYLRPITKDYRVTLRGCAWLLAKWRGENPSMSARPFLATEENTERWLDELVIDRDDRILFLIIAADGTMIGHIGYSAFDYDEKSCEVDAVLRGEKTLIPGMMTFAIRALIDWGLADLRLEIIRLRVFADNLQAIHFYEKNFFLSQEQNPPAERSNEKQFIVMQLQEDRWKINNFIHND